MSTVAPKERRWALSLRVQGLTLGARAPVVVVATLVVLAAAGAGCRSAPDPSTLFAEAEAAVQRADAAGTRAAATQFTAAADGWRAQGRTTDAARAADAAGRAWMRLGELRASLAAHEQALTLAGDDRGLRVRAAAAAGSVTAMLAVGPDDFARATVLCHEAKTSAESAADDAFLAEAAMCLAEVAYHRQDLEAALPHYADAVRLLGERDHAATAEALVLMGSVQSDLGQFDAAAAAFDRANTMLRDAADTRLQQILAVSVAKLELRRGQFQPALDGFEAALTAHQRMGDIVWEAVALGGIAQVYFSLGDTAAALPRWETAAQLFDRAGVQMAMLDQLLLLGETYLALGDETRAIERFELARKRTDALGLGSLEGQALRLLGHAHLVRKRPDLARPYLEQALSLGETLGEGAEFQLQAQTLNDLAEAHRQLRDYTRARETLQRSLRVSGAGQDRPAEAAARYTLARTAMDEGKLSEARAEIAAALQLVNSLRNEVSIRELRASFVASVFRWHELQVDILMQLARGGEARRYEQQAFEASERSRARTLLDGLPGETTPIARAARVPEIRSALGHDTLLLEYLLGDDRSYLWVLSDTGLRTYVLPSRAEIEPLAARAYALLTSRLSAAEDGGDDARADGEYRQVSARLSDVLVKPIVERRPGQRLLLVADGGLHSLPFAALPIPGATVETPLLMEHEVVNLPSASALLALRRVPRPTATSIAVFADPVFDADDPRLPARANVTPDRRSLFARWWPAGPPAATQPQPDGTIPRLAATRDEALAIREMSGSRALTALDFDATRELALDPRLTNYRVVHFATHALVDNRNPTASGILLSQYGPDGSRRNGFLRLSEIYDMRLPAELIVLSACNTALGQPMRGEGHLGMVRGFMHAGAARIVATHWKVDDAATGELMRRFYAGMLKRGQSPSAALRQAQMSVRALDRWSAPYYWAGFVIHGDWR